MRHQIKLVRTHSMDRGAQAGAVALVVTLGIAWMSLAGAAAGTPLERQASGAKAQTQKSAPSQKAKLDISFKSDPAPPKTGENMFEVTLKGSDGKAITDADVSLNFYMAAMPEMKMPAMRNSVPLKHQSNGQYHGTGNVMMAGKWDLTVVAKKGGKEIGRKKFTVTAT